MCVIYVSVMQVNCEAKKGKIKKYIRRLKKKTPTGYVTISIQFAFTQ